MKAILSLALLLSAGLQTLQADVKSDLLNLTGGREVRAVWIRFPWCDSNYTPIQAYSSLDGVGSSKFNQVAVYGTGDGKVRLLDNGKIDNHMGEEIFITRKDGSHVVWSNPTTKTAWIQAFDGNTPPVNLNLGTDYQVYALHYNPATGEENLFVITTNKRIMYRIPLKSDYTADLPKKIEVVSGTWAGGTTDDGFAIDASFSVSADAKMCGGAFPWPTTMILDMVNKQVHQRHAGTFGCNANIAPDNSYRFFHFMDDHCGVYMFDKSLSVNFWTVPLNKGLPGNTLSTMDVQNPRFTSDAQFMTVTYPGPYDGLEVPGSWNSYFSMTAAQVKALNPSKVGHFCLGKLSPDFKSIEKWALISGGEDVRIIESADGGMAWVGPATAGVNPAGPATRSTSKPSILVSGNSIEAALQLGQNGTISILSTSGRVVARSLLHGGTVRVKATPATYLVSIARGANAEVVRVSVNR